ncbi:hypothetical protein UFOVP59_55 [uncultured Caudovirales phage]|uniref:Uncharacterized protein n=1 Tax=uncultured Caudovirales phage TaxID=2100421 RepID=A0A6J5KY56_9CAUD|nr:hypothetical protein UFOVP59_55 [uncultured Caudovirales phage]CAB5220944.1 hypothetical protein UFOVP246_60 [uncultured Caudovirales phage]
MAFLSTRPLNDNTKGFRFDFIGNKGIYRVRKFKSRKLAFEAVGDTFFAIHMGKRSLYMQQTEPLRALHDFALRSMGKAK